MSWQSRAVAGMSAAGAGMMAQGWQALSEAWEFENQRREACGKVMDNKLAVDKVKTSSPDTVLITTPYGNGKCQPGHYVALLSDKKSHIKHPCAEEIVKFADAGRRVGLSAKEISWKLECAELFWRQNERANGRWGKENEEAADNSFAILNEKERAEVDYYARVFSLWQNMYGDVDHPALLPEGYAYGPDPQCWQILPNGGVGLVAPDGFRWGIEPRWVSFDKSGKQGQLSYDFAKQWLVTPRGGVPVPYGSVDGKWGNASWSQTPGPRPHYPRLFSMILDLNGNSLPLAQITETSGKRDELVPWEKIREPVFHAMQELVRNDKRLRREGSARKRIERLPRWSELTRDDIMNLSIAVWDLYRKNHPWKYSMAEHNLFWLSQAVAMKNWGKQKWDKRCM